MSQYTVKNNWCKPYLFVCRKRTCFSLFQILARLGLPLASFVVYDYRVHLRSVVWPPSLVVVIGMRMILFYTCVAWPYHACHWTTHYPLEVRSSCQVWSWTEYFLFTLESIQLTTRITEILVVDKSSVILVNRPKIRLNTSLSSHWRWPFRLLF